MKKIKVAFICVHNSCRSQMAEAIFKDLFKDKYEVYSAGTEEYPEVKPLAIKVVEEIDINIRNQYPKLIKDIPKPDVVITMGCNVNCPIVPSLYTEDWGLDDPSGKGVEEFRITRNLIIEKSKELEFKLKNLEQNIHIEEA